MVFRSLVFIMLMTSRIGWAGAHYPITNPAKFSTSQFVSSTGLAFRRKMEFKSFDMIVYEKQIEVSGEPMTLKSELFLGKSESGTDLQKYDYVVLAPVKDQACLDAAWKQFKEYLNVFLESSGFSEDQRNLAREWADALMERRRWTKGDITSRQSPRLRLTVMEINNKWRLGAQVSLR